MKKTFATISLILGISGNILAGDYTSVVSSTGTFQGDHVLTITKPSSNFGVNGTITYSTPYLTERLREINNKNNDDSEVARHQASSISHQDNIDAMDNAVAVAEFLK